MKRALIVLGLVACASPQPGTWPTPSPAASCETGVLGTFGPVPSTMLVLRMDSRGSLELTGPLVDRLALLTGALITACGNVTNTPGSSMDVDRFELRQIDGLQAYAGVIERRGAGYALAPGGSRPPVPLTDVPSEFNEKVGATVWVAGIWIGGAFAVKSFGLMPLSPT